MTKATNNDLIAAMVSLIRDRIPADFAALPAPSHMKPKRPWHHVLGISAAASKAEVETAFRLKAKEAHPDAGGSSDLMHELNEAKREALS